MTAHLHNHELITAGALLAVGIAVVAALVVSLVVVAQMAPEMASQLLYVFS